MLNQKLKALWIACGTEDPSHDDKITFGSTIIALAMVAVAQIKTEVPAVVRGAKPVAVEHIKIHGAALEGRVPTCKHAITHPSGCCVEPMVLNKSGFDPVTDWRISG